MLTRLLLIIVQLAAGGLVAVRLPGLMPSYGTADIFILACAFAIVVWLLGAIAALITNDVSRPSGSALFLVLLFAMIFAGITFLPDIKQAIDRVWEIPVIYYPLIGAVVAHTIQP